MDLQDAYEAIERGETLATMLANGHAPAIIRYSGGLNYIRVLGLKRRLITRHVRWIHGPTGLGKTRRAHYLLPDAYWKPAGKWFSGYDGETQSIWDDYRRDWISFSLLLRCLDRYPLTVEMKGSAQCWLAEEIIITSPHSPQDVYGDMNPEDVQQLIRRIDIIEEITEPWTEP